MAELPSRFLPAGFDGRPVCLLAGKGRYPALTVERIREAGLPVRLIAFEGETAGELWDAFGDAERASVKVGQLGHLLKALPRLGAGYAIMAGQITPRRLFRGLHPDLKALQILHSLDERNAETIFGALADEIEALGIRLLDARAFLDEELAHEGLMTRGRQKAEDRFLRHGIHIAKGLADLDVGQGCVVRHGTVVAAEAFEGTDPMLERAGSFKTDDLIFVKTVKRVQDYRFDVPVFGSRTLEVMREHGIRSAALEAGRVLMLDKDEVLRTAGKMKIEIIGYRFSGGSPENR